MQEGNNGIIYSNVSGESRNSNNECDKLNPWLFHHIMKDWESVRLGLIINKFKNPGWEIYKVDLKSSAGF